MPEVYLPYRQAYYDAQPRAMSVVVRTSGSVEGVSAMLRAAVRELDKDQPIGPIRPMDDLLNDSVAPRRLNLLLIGVFALAALALTAAGLYGVMVYIVALRTREIGIRMALGATGASVLGLVLRQAGAMTLTGIAVGILGRAGAGPRVVRTPVRRQRDRSVRLPRRVAAAGLRRPARRSGAVPPRVAHRPADGAPLVSANANPLRP